MKVIIVGAGEVGFHIASRLVLENKDVVVIDKDPEAIRRVSDSLDVQAVSGTGGSPLTLEEAGLREAEILLAVTDSDEANLVTCLVANIISPNTKKLARIRGAEYDAFIDKLRENAPKIDTIINPEVELVKTIDRLMNIPGAVDIGEFEGGQIKFVAITLDSNAHLVGAKLMELDARIGKKRPLIAAIVRDEVLIIPGGNDRLMAGDLIYFITEENRLFETLAVFDKHGQPAQSVLIIGGGATGHRLARLLEEKSVHVKIVEKRQDRCSTLAAELNKTIVLCGDGSDQRLLSEENVQNMDAVVTLTNDEETNILTSLLAKRLGVKKVITKVAKFAYFPLMKTIGIDLVVSGRLSAINSILQHIRKGKVLSSISIKDEHAEVMEAVAMETSDIVGRPLKALKFPKGALVTGIIRDKHVIIPDGESVIAPGDRIIIFAVREAISKVEKILAVKLEYF